MLSAGGLSLSVSVSFADVAIRVLSVRVTNAISRAAVLWFAVIAALATPANAEVKAYYRSGNWTNYVGISDKNTPLCAMMQAAHSWGEWKTAGIKYQPDGKLYVQLSVDRWRIRPGTQVGVEVGFDRNGWQGKAITLGAGETIFINIMPEDQEGFLHEVGEANTMWFRFAAASEWTWSFDMAGSRNSMNALRECIAKISQPVTPTYAQPAPAPAPSPQAPAPQESLSSGKSSVPIYTDRGGSVVMVDVLLGGQPLRMVLDTGATTCLVTEAIAARIVSSGQGSWGELVRVELADGSKVTQRSLIIHELRIGSHVVRNVRASVSSSQEMLLAFPVVNSIAPFTIDTRTRELVFHHGSAS